MIAATTVSGRLRVQLQHDTAERQLRELEQDAPPFAEAVLVVPSGMLVQPACRLLAQRDDLAAITIESSSAATVRSWCRALRNGGVYD